MYFHFKFGPRLISVPGAPTLLSRALARCSFRFRAAGQFNQPTQHRRDMENCQEFKREIKAWIKVNVSYE